MAVLTVPDEPARERSLAARGTAQLADHALLGAAVEVYVLARERRAPAIRAAAAIGLQRTETAPEQDSLEQLYVGGGG